jgi:hypothetical protein
MSVPLFDLGQRLHAAVLQQPVPRATFAPVLKPVNPLAVAVTGSGEHTLVRAADRSGLSSATGLNALSALGERGVSLKAEPRTLVVADHEVLHCLVELAVVADPAGPHAGAAAVVAWWSMRAEHPGTGAVLTVLDACSARWVLGLPPAGERQLDLWRTWLKVPQRGPLGLLALADRVSEGTALPGLELYADEDRESWDAFTARLRDRSGWDWRKRDTRREAAVGLAARCDAAELWASLRLGDPLVATRESFGGTVVSGIITSIPSRAELSVKLDQLTCRLRADTAVEGFPGAPRDLPPAAGAAAVVRGRVVATRVLPDERLLITIGVAITRANVLRAGQRLTLRPRSVDPRLQCSGRQELHRRYAARRSWLSGGPPPVPRRRDVPLDVVVAAAG